MIKLNATLTSNLDDGTSIQVKLERSIRKGLDIVARDAVNKAEQIGRAKGIRDDTGKGADRPYNKSFTTINSAAAGGRFRWQTTVVNTARDANVQEYGRKKGRMPPATPIEEWMERKGFFNQEFMLNKTRRGKQLIQPRNEKGQFARYKRATRHEQVWLMRRKIQSTTYKGHFVMRDLARVLNSKQVAQVLSQVLKDYLR